MEIKQSFGQRPLLISKGPLLNFWEADFRLPHPITGESFPYDTVEHRFQAMKAMFLLDQKDYVKTHNTIANQFNPRAAKQAGRRIAIDQNLWDRASFWIMVEAQLAKFNEHVELANKLYETANRKLIEHRPDPIWGDNMDGTGRNLCGKSLMIVRSILRES